MKIKEKQSRKKNHVMSENIAKIIKKKKFVLV